MPAISSSLQQLTSDFRVDYANFWLSILNADTEGIKTYADKLGVGQLYGLFACMVAGRSWNSIQRGIDREKKSAEEVREISNCPFRSMMNYCACLYLPSISSIPEP